MNLDTFINCISRLYDGDKLEPEMLRKIDIKAYELLDLMKTGEIDYDTQNALDLYISYYDGNNYLDSEKTKILMTYYNIIEENNNNKLAKEKQNKPKVLSIKPINSDGIISAVTVIEFVVVVGVLVALFAIALLKI